MTGHEIESALLNAISRQPNISIFENHLAIDLITSRKVGLKDGNRCLGAYVFDKNNSRVETFSASVTLLATGGCGKVYQMCIRDRSIITASTKKVAYSKWVSLTVSWIKKVHGCNSKVK